MFKDYLDKSNFEETGFSYTLSLISGKYKINPLLSDGI